MKIVINACFGGFGLSDAAMRAYAELKGIRLYPETEAKGFVSTTYWTVPAEQRKSDAFLYDRDIARNDPALVQVVETLGKAANGSFAELRVVEIPDDVEWEISEYDGAEHVAEQHRTWE